MSINIDVSTLTTNLNFLQQVNWKMTVLKPSFANVQYYCTEVNLPEISMPAVKLNYQNQEGWFPGDTLAYGLLKIKFMVDESMQNYMEAYNWLVASSSQVSPRLTIPSSTVLPLRADINLAIQTAENTTNRQFQFHDAFPESISELIFSTKATEIQYIECEMVLRFSYFTIK